MSKRTIEVDVGTPLQYLVLSPSTTTDITLLIDANCRPLFRADCPAYCVNTAFQQVYCPLDCVKDGHSVNCKDPAQFILENYQPLNSSTAVVSSDTWTGTLDLYTNQFGQWATDFFSFESADDDGQRLNVSEWPFVSGLVLDGGLFWNSNGVIGLAPGPSNFVQLLYERGEIPQPILSVVFDEFRFTVGDFGGDFCGEWLKFEVTNPHWMVAFQSAQLGDFHLQGNILVTFSLHLDNVFIPDEAFDRLFKKGIITNYAPNYFKILCTASIDLEFTGQDSRILLPSAFLIDGQPTDEDCYTSVLPLRDFYSAHLPSVSFGILRRI
ncbi:hypothetical protein M3Y99_00466200 [Aphelenchoides fujianensis]|nr:hypothetical protein M3Y99_00466200 [Aphelenchoides fujianensis]